MSREPSASEPPAPGLRRLHPSAYVVKMVDVRRLAIVALPAIAGGGRQFWVAAGMVALIAVLAVTATAIEVSRFRYQVQADSLLVQGGLLFRYRRVVPFARVQSIDVVQRLRHRLFGVVELRVEAIGGRSTEAVFSALAPKEAERLRLTVLRGSEAAPTDEEITGPDNRPWWDDRPVTERPSEPVLASMSPRDLLLYGATGGRVAIIALLLAQGLEFLPVESIGSAVERSAPGVVAASVAVLALVAITVSLVLTVLTFWDFRLWREDDRLVVERGLLEHRRQMVPIHRVQAVRITANLVRRWLGLATLTVLVAGQAGGDAQEREERSVLLPIGPRDEVLSLAARVLGAEIPGDLEPMPMRAFAHMLVRDVFLVGVPAVAAALALGPAWLLLSLLLVPKALISFGAWRGLGLRDTPTHVVVRSGVLEREMTVVPVSNVQDLRLQIHPRQRLLGLASVRMSLAKGGATARHLDSALAHALHDDLGRRVAASHWQAPSA